jgi:hypothetical protein
MNFTAPKLGKCLKTQMPLEASMFNFKIEDAINKQEKLRINLCTRYSKEYSSLNPKKDENFKH